MTSRERIKQIVAGEAADRCGFWMGQPHSDTWPIYFKYFGIVSHATGDPKWNPEREEALRLHLGDDIRWICPQWTAYKHPGGKPMWEDGHDQTKGLASEGVFADCEDLAVVEDFPWPNPDYLDFSDMVRALKNTGPYYRLGGMWCPFFHNLADFFGMENYFVKMHTDPEVVEAVTRHVCEFYLEANERLFEQAGDELDAFFFGNDLGSQRSCLVSPAFVDRFVLPWIRKFAQQGHAHGYQVAMHSCGAISPLIDRVIDAGVNVLHPLQAKAANMDAKTLSQFKGRLAFLGGIDTQDLLVNGTPEDVRKDVLRVRDLLGPSFIISPSHEALLPNVPPENVEAMARAKDA
jgi:uroporphyrinogen decarboxylase